MFETEEGQVLGMVLAENMRQKSEHQYSVAFRRARSLSLMHFRQPDLVFCFSPNYIALASIHNAFKHMALNGHFLLGTLHHHILGLPVVTQDMWTGEQQRAVLAAAASAGSNNQPLKSEHKISDEPKKKT